jgi:hypothetical protein
MAAIVLSATIRMQLAMISSHCFTFVILDADGRVGQPSTEQMSMLHKFSDEIWRLPDRLARESEIRPHQSNARGHARLSRQGRRMSRIYMVSERIRTMALSPPANHPGASSMGSSKSEGDDFSDMKSIQQDSKQLREFRAPVRRSRHHGAVLRFWQCVRT